MNNETTPYVRGTKTHRMTTARLTTGVRILTTGADEAGTVGVAVTKGDAMVRTVAGLTAAMVGARGFHRNQQRRYTVTFADGTTAGNLAPVQSWHAVTAPTVPAVPAVPDGWTDAQHNAIRSLCERYGVPFDASAFAPAFDLPAGWLAGWIGDGRLFVGVAPDGSVSS